MSTDTENLTHLDPWSQRYIKEGHIWGDEASYTARILIDELSKQGKLNNKHEILEIGFGYGRDLIALAQEGLVVHGVEEASAGLTEAANQLNEFVEGGKAFLTLGDFTQAKNLQDAFFDAVVSHRMLHLVHPNKIKAMVNKIASALKPEGWLVISARNPDDFNAEQMKKIGLDTAEYITRPGHIINFWNEDRFRKSFSNQFNIISFYKGTEIESQQNPVDSHFTVMVAKRKTAEEMRNTPVMP